MSFGFGPSRSTPGLPIQPGDSRAKAANTISSAHLPIHPITTRGDQTAYHPKTQTLVSRLDQGNYHAVFLDSSPEFEALSYRWASSELDHELVVDGYRFSITKSAFDLLFARRWTWRDRTVWIDAICINQNDNAEKASQITIMRDIYKQAERVVFYPGGDWRSHLTAPLIYEIYALSLQFSDSAMKLSKMTQSGRGTRKWLALTDLLTNEYFKRFWALQEIVVCEKVQMYHGGLYIPWDIFVTVASQIWNPHRRNMLSGANPNRRTWVSGNTFENLASTNSGNCTTSAVLLTRPRTLRAAHPNLKPLTRYPVTEAHGIDGVVVCMYAWRNRSGKCYGTDSNQTIF